MARPRSKILDAILNGQMQRSAQGQVTTGPQGGATPKDPSMVESLAYMALPFAGQAIGNKLGAGFSGGLDKVFDGIGGQVGSIFGSGSTGAATTAATGAAPAAPAGLTGSFLPGAPSAGMGSGLSSSIFSSAGGLSALPLAGAGLGGYQAVSNIQKGRPLQAGLGGALAGASTGMMVGGPVGAGIGAAIGGVGSALGAGLNSPPHPDTVDRKNSLSELQNRGLLGPGNTLSLAGGQTGKIGSYNVENNSPDKAMGQAVGMINPLAEILVSEQTGEYKGDADKRRADLAGQLTNTVTGAGGNTWQNVRGLYEKLGMDRDSAYTKIGQLAGTGQITEQERDAYFAAIDSLFGVANKNASAEDQARFQSQQDMISSGEFRAPGGTWAPPPTPQPGVIDLTNSTDAANPNASPKVLVAAPRPGIQPGAEAATNVGATPQAPQPASNNMYKLMDKVPPALQRSLWRAR